MVFIELPLFQKYLSFSDEALRQLQDLLISQPDAGDLIPGSGGLRKLRFPLPGRGKRGGARVIYYWHTPKSLCFLLLAYPKNRMEDLTDKQVNILSEVVKEELSNG
jgi:hypothetical protein